MKFRRALWLAIPLVAITFVALAPDAKSEPTDEGVPVPVRFAEGTTHGFLRLSTPGGAKLADGDLLVTVKGGVATSRMVFHFTDKSFFEETVTFAQNRTFALRDYHLVHRGPAFPFDIDARLARSGKYTVVSKEHDKDGKDDVHHYEGTLELPADTYNGMVITIAKNLARDETRRVHIVAFTPKPMMIEIAYVLAPRVRVSIGAHGESAMHYVLKPKLGSITGALAHVVGKSPPDSHAWIVTDDVPAFLRFEGPLFTGPVWRIELATPQLQRQP
jgi:hypothetical protein